MWCVLGTLGSFFAAASRSDDFRFLFSPPDLPCPRAEADAGTDWLAGMSLEPLSDREGFDDDDLRWCPRPKKGTDVAAAALGTAEQTSVEVSPPAVDAVEATRRTEEGSMMAVAEGEWLSRGTETDRGLRRAGFGIVGGWPFKLRLKMDGYHLRTKSQNRVWPQWSGKGCSGAPLWSGANCEWPKATITAVVLWSDDHRRTTDAIRHLPTGNITDWRNRPPLSGMTWKHDDALLHYSAPASPTCFHGL